MQMPLPASRKLKCIQVKNHSLCPRLTFSVTDMHQEKFPSLYHIHVIVGQRNKGSNGQKCALPYEEHLKCDPYLSYMYID